MRPQISRGPPSNGTRRGFPGEPSLGAADFERVLEVEAQLRRHRARRHIVRAAEGRKEVVQRFLVGDVDHGQCQAPTVVIPVEQIVVAYRQVEQIARSDALWIVVVVLRARRGHFEEE